MAVRTREYNDDYGKAVWGYDFSFRRERYREAGYATREEALFAEADARKKARSGQKRIKLSSLETIITEFIDNRNGIKAPNTIDRERRRARVILKYFPDKILSRITNADIEKHIQARLKEGKAPRTINLELTFLSSLFKYAISHSYAFDNPVTKVEYPTVIKMKRSLPSDEFIIVFLEEAAKTSTGKQLVTWILVSIYAGLRPNESFHLEWPDIDFENDTIDIQPKIDTQHNVENRLKSRKYRPVTMHPDLKPVLLEWRKEWNAILENEGQKHDWVFFHPRRHYLRAKGFRKCFEEAKARAIKIIENKNIQAGIKMTSKKVEGYKMKLTPYTLRHIFTTKAIKSRMDRGALKDELGHSSTRMIDEYYCHLDHDFRMDEMKKVNIGLKKCS